MGMPAIWTHVFTCVDRHVCALLWPRVFANMVVLQVGTRMSLQGTGEIFPDPPFVSFPFKALIGFGANPCNHPQQCWMNTSHGRPHNHFAADCPKNPLPAAGMRKGGGRVTPQHPGKPCATQGTRPKATFRAGNRTALACSNHKTTLLPHGRVMLGGRGVTRPWWLRTNPSSLAGISWFNQYHAWHTGCTPPSPALEALAQGIALVWCMHPSTPHTSPMLACGPSAPLLDAAPPARAH